MEDSKIIVSVLMSTYQESIDVLKKAVDSILNQTFRELQLIIIIDDPDNEEIIDLIKGYNDERIMFYINESNIGIVRSLNRGLSFCKGQYVARMDADDIALPDRIEMQLRYMKRYNLDIVGTDIEKMIDENVHSKIIKCPKRYNMIKKGLTYVNCVKHPTWLVRKSVYDELKGYKDIHTCEDYHFLMRAIKVGYKIGNTGTVGLRYRQNINSISRKNNVYQTVAFDYLRKMYSKGDIPDEMDFKNYMDSDYVKKKSQDILSYNRLKRCKRYFHIIANGLFYKEIYQRLAYQLIMLLDVFS